MSDANEELARLRELYQRTLEAYNDVATRHKAALQSSEEWHRYEQQLVHRRNELHSALGSLGNAILHCGEEEP